MENYLERITKKHLAESKAETGDANPQQEMSKTIWEIGYPELHEVFVPIQVGKGVTSHIVPVPDELDASTMTAGDFGITFVGMTYNTIPIDQIKGLNVGWTREYLEDCAWDAIAPQLKEVGRAIEQDIFEFCLGLLDATKATEGTIVVSGTMVYADFVEGISQLKAKDYNADICILNPIEYCELLLDEQFIDASVMGTAGPIGSGIIQTTLGCKVVSSSLVPSGTVYWIDSGKALALIMRRDRSTEEYSAPSANLYGVVASVRYGGKVILSDAIAVGEKAA